MQLEEKLAILRDADKKRFSLPQAVVLNNHITSLRKSMSESILKRGQAAPGFSLRNQKGELVSSSDLLKKGPLIVNFSRGGWCAFCAEDVRFQNDSYVAFKDAGAELVVISPQSDESTESQARADDLHFNLLSDHGNEVGRAFGVVYTFPDDLKNIYRSTLLVDVASLNKSYEWALPIPARFIIGSDGIILDVKADPDYRFRPEPSEAWEILNRLNLITLPCERGIDCD